MVCRTLARRLEFGRRPVVGAAKRYMFATFVLFSGVTKTRCLSALYANPYPVRRRLVLDCAGFGTRYSCGDALAATLACSVTPLGFGDAID